VSGVQAATSPGSWQVLRSVSPDPTKVDDSLFAGVSMASASDGWAVGRFSNPQAVNQPLAEHWNGHAWRITAAPPLPATAASGVLNGVDELDAGSNVAQGLFEHFNGTTWQAAPPLTAPGIPDFMAVSAVSTGDVWAVGSALNVNDSTLAAHWDGHAWQVVTTPRLNGAKIILKEDACRRSNNELTGVTAVAADNVWASGFETENSDFHVPYVLHWDGTTWSLIKTANPGTGQGNVGSSLFAITALSASDVWTVGHSQNGNGTITTLTEQFNGSTWSVVPSPNPGLLGVDSLFGVARAGGGQLSAIGSDEQSGQCCIRTLGLRTTSG
jgi:hypothetical protein